MNPREPHRTIKETPSEYQARMQRNDKRVITAIACFVLIMVVLLAVLLW